MEIKYKKAVIHQSVGGVEMETEVLLPDFGDEQEQRPIGIWGRRHLRYIREYRKALYTELLTTGRLNDYLAELNEQAQARFEVIVDQMKAAEGVTEDMKRRDWLSWVQAMGSIRNRAEEVICAEMVYL